MRKKISKVLSVFLALGCGLVGVACNGTSTEEKRNALCIEVFKGGYGVDWVYALADKYTQKTGQNVIITVQVGNQGVSNMTTNLNSLATETDLFFTKMNASFCSEIYKGTRSINGQQYDCLYADVTDLYNSEIEGEGVLYKDKIFSSYNDYYNVDGKYYTTSWVSGMVGIIVNMDVWNSSWQFPRTTDELLELCGTIESDSGDLAPFIYSASDEYWTMLSQIWMNQYEGNEQMDKFYAGYDYDGKRYSDNMVAYDGYYEMLKFYEKLLKKENGYMHSASKDADFTNMQGMFLQGKAVMTPNGDWLEREMLYNYPDANIKMIKTPIISALANKCSFANAEDAETKLRALVDYVDANASGYADMPSGCTEADVDIVREARSVQYTAGAEHCTIIPCYSNQIEAAKDFLLFMASDEGMKIYRENTSGGELPFTATTTTTSTQSYTSFRQSVTSIISSSNMRFIQMKDKIYTIGGINPYLTNNSYGGFVTCFSAESSSDYVSADAYYQAEVLKVKNMLPSAKRLCGL